MIACINFTNLSTARAGKRAKEIGLRKVMGVQRWHLIQQFLEESVFIAFLALVVALGLVYSFLPGFNTLTGSSLALNFSTQLTIWAGMLAIAICTGLISGFYPALSLASLQPVHALTHQSGKTGTFSAGLKKWLVISQMIFSMILIVIALTVRQQMTYIQNKSLGYDNKMIINIGGYLSRAAEREIVSHPNVLGVTRSTVPGRDIRGNDSFSWPGKNPGDEVTIYPVLVDDAYLKTFGMTMQSGRFFSKEFPSDMDNIVINETAARVMGLDQPLGTLLRYEIQDIGTGEYENKEALIIGVMEAFHQNSLHHPIVPMVFQWIPWHPSVSIKIRETHVKETIAFIEDAWNRHVDYPKAYSFLKDRLQDYYADDEKTGAIILFLSVLGIALSCMGLIGLVSYSTELRKKEIGIRKVVGASVPAITSLLSREFLSTAGLAMLIALPAAWLMGTQWLNTFEYRIHMQINTLILAGLIVLGTGFVSICIQLVRAARANPVDSLRNE